jgi:hypothetical protein
MGKDSQPLQLILDQEWHNGCAMDLFLLTVGWRSRRCSLRADRKLSQEDSLSGLRGEQQRVTTRRKALQPA